MERTIKSESSRKNGFVELTETDSVNPWYTVYSDGKQRLTTHDLDEAMKEFQSRNH